MSEWNEYALSDLANYINGYAFKPEDWTREGLKIVRIEQLNNPSGEYDFCKINIPAKNLIDDGDLLFSWSATLKVLIWKHGPAALNQHLFKVVENEKTTRLFLNQLLDFHMDNLAAGSHGSTMKHIKRGELDKYKVRIPDVTEQKQITKVLSVLDTQIEQTEALISKQENIRQGLMQDLFTRGVDETGQLRPAYKDAPHLYHETELGWMPLGWKVKPFEEFCDRVCVGIVIQPAKYYVTDGVPTLRSANVTEVGLNSENLVYISANSNQLLFKSQIRAGDILTVRTGYPGTSAVVPPEYSGSNCVDIIISSPKPGQDSHFLCYWVNSPFGKEQVLSKQGGLAQQHFNVGEMRNLLVADPLEPERDLIRDIITEMDSKISTENILLKKLQKQKAGLMRDLLSGDVSVAPLMQDASA